MQIFLYNGYKAVVVSTVVVVGPNNSFLINLD